MIEEVTQANLADFLHRKPYSVIHIDANWDGHLEQIVEKIHALEPGFEQDVSFGYIDADTEQNYAREVGVLNLPSVAYYRGDHLVGLIIGLKQDIAQNIRRVRFGGSL